MSNASPSLESPESVKTTDTDVVPVDAQAVHTANDRAAEQASAQLPKRPKLLQRWLANVDLLALIMVAIFAINLAFYLHCMHVNLASINERDNHPPARADDNDPNDSGRAERKRIERGEAEQLLHDPNHYKEPAATDRDDSASSTSPRDGDNRDARKVARHSEDSSANASSKRSAETGHSKRSKPLNDPNHLSGPNRSKERNSGNNSNNSVAQRTGANQNVPTKKRIADRNANTTEQIVKPFGGAPAKFDINWLATVLPSKPGRQALESLVKRNDELALTEEQTKKLLTPKASKKQPELNKLIDETINVLHSKQLEYLLSKQKYIEQQSIYPLSTSMLIDNTCEQLSVIKLDHPKIATSPYRGKASWSCRQLAIGISLLTAMPDEEYRLDRRQAQKLIKCLQKLGDIDKEIEQECNVPLPIGDILSEKQLHYLFEQLSKNDK